MQRAVIGGRGRFVIGADRIVRTQFEPLQSCVQDAPERSGRRNEAAEGALVPGGRRVDQDTKAAGRSEPGRIPQRIDALLQGAGRIAAFERDLGHQRVREPVQHRVGGSAVIKRRVVLAFPQQEARKELGRVIPDGIAGKPFGHRRLVKLDEEAFPKLLDGGQPIGP